MNDRSSRPHTSPNRTPARRERRIITIRLDHRGGPARIAYLGLSPSTVHRVLARYQLARLRHVDRATGQPIRRYEHPAPGDLIHLDITKLGNIPGRRRPHSPRPHSGPPQQLRTPRPGPPPQGAPAGQPRPQLPAQRRGRPQQARLHRDPHRRAPADRGRILATNPTVLPRQQDHRSSRVLTDNGSCYRSHLRRDTLATQVSPTNARALAVPRPTAKSNASTAPRSTNRPTPAPTRQKPNDEQRSRDACTPTITTATPHSQANHPPAAFPT